MKVIIAGSRHFNDYKLLKEKCDYYIGDNKNVIIVSGRCRGADQLGEQYAEEKGYPIVGFPADWNKYGKAAGPIRNQQMAEYADHLIAFLYNNSRGTKNMIETAKKFELKIRVIKPNEEDI